MLSLACLLSHKHCPCFVPLQSVPWKMRPMRMEQRPRWSATAASVPVGTGCAPQWRARVRMLSRKSPCLGLDTRNPSHTLSFQRHQLSRVLLSPVFPQLLHGWFLHNPHMFHISQTQADTAPEVRKHVTRLGAMLLGFVVWVWCHENLALNLPDQIYSASKWYRPNRSLAATVHVGVSKSAFLSISSLYLCLWNL